MLPMVGMALLTKTGRVFTMNRYQQSLMVRVTRDVGIADEIRRSGPLIQASGLRNLCGSATEPGYRDG